jgi:16S rRNA (cytidine1402-2'-O)-methyltransferase
MLNCLLDVCAETTRLCVASNLTLPGESVRSMTITEWKNSRPHIGRHASVFLLYGR